MMHRTISWLKLRSARAGRIIDGTPSAVIRNGEWQPEVVAGMRLRQEDLEAAARAAKVTGVDKIDYAILERNGRISVFRKDNQDS